MLCATADDLMLGIGGGVTASELELLSRLKRYLAWGGWEMAVAIVTHFGCFLFVCLIQSKYKDQNNTHRQELKFP